MPNDWIDRLKLFVDFPGVIRRRERLACSARTPGEGKEADALAEQRFLLVAWAPRNPSPDSIPDTVLIGFRQTVNVLNEITERLLVVSRPIDRQIQGLSCERVGLRLRHQLAGAGRVLPPPRAMGVVTDRNPSIELVDAQPPTYLRITPRDVLEDDAPLLDSRGRLRHQAPEDMLQTALRLVRPIVIDPDRRHAREQSRDAR